MVPYRPPSVRSLAARLAGVGFLSLAVGSIAPSGLGAAEPAITVKEADCRMLVKHVPSPDVAYRPGVDVNGDPVAPADLGGGYRVALPETVQIQITVLLQERFGIPANSVLYKGEAEIGVAEVSLDGERVSFNGQDLTSAESRALAAACREILGGG